MKTLLICLLVCAASWATADIQKVNLGTSPTGATGDTARTAFTKVNDNFDFLTNYIFSLNYVLTNYVGTNVPSGGVTNNTSLQGGGNVIITTNGINDFTVTVPNLWLYVPTNTVQDGYIPTAAGTNGDTIWSAGPRQEWAYAPSTTPWTPTFDGRVNHVYTLTNNSTINISGTNGNVSILCYSNITVSFTGTTISWGTSNSPPTICTNAVIGLTAYGPKVVGGYKELQ